MRYLRCAGVFIGGVLFQWWWPEHFAILGYAPSVLFILVMAVASLASAPLSLTMAFFWGLFLDIQGVHLFGGNALALTLTAYLVGLVKRQMDVSNPLSQGMFAALSSIVYGLFLAVVGLVFKGDSYWPGWGVFLVTPIFNAVIAPFSFAIVRRQLRP